MKIFIFADPKTPRRGAIEVFGINPPSGGQGGKTKGQKIKNLNSKRIYNYATTWN